MKTYTRDFFVKKGKDGIKSRNKKLTKKQLSEIAHKGWATKRAKLDKHAIHRAK